MIASTAVWAARGVDGRNVPSAQMELLRAAASTRAPRRHRSRARCTCLDTHPLARANEDRARAVTGRRPHGRAQSPALRHPTRSGRRVSGHTGSRRPRGWLMIGIGRDQFAIHTAPISNPAQPIPVRFPVPVRGIVVRGDEDARQIGARPGARACGVDAAGSIGCGVCAHRRRYGRKTVFFLDDRSFPEPEAFWVGGARASSFAIQPDDAQPSVSMVLRNGPLPNQVTMNGGRRANHVGIRTRRGETCRRRRGWFAPCGCSHL